MEEKSQNPLENIDLKEIFKLLWLNKFKIIFFCIIVTSITIMYALSLPNIYQSSIIFEKQGSTQSSSSSGRLSALAGLAGIQIGNSGGENLPDKMKFMLNDYYFNKKIVEKYELDKLIASNELFEGYIFSKNISFFYELLNSTERRSIEKLDANSRKNIVKSIMSMVSLQLNKSGFLILKVTHPNKKFAKKLVDIYLKELAMELKYRDVLTLDKQISFYSKELSKASSVELKSQLSTSITDLLKKKVLSDVNELYLFDVIVPSREAFIEEKEAPKRANIVIAAFLFSIVFALAVVIVRDFIMKSKEEDSKE